MTDLAAILERHHRRGHICDQANADIDALLKMIVQGPPLPPEAVLHDAASSLNSLVNILLDNPMTQFSFEWILSLNWLFQKWGQVQSAYPP